MQNPPDPTTQPIQDARANGMEDSPMMTIEYLRARLLAERSVSKTAKERADELAKRVTELEEQLKNVTLHRKRAEKATLDVISFLASRGISDISEVYESESDHDESLCESNTGKSDATKKEENFGSSVSKGNDLETSDSDHESTPSSGRSLSWKGRKETTRIMEKKTIDSSIRRRTSLAHVSSSPRHRAGKSCRQNKRRELRATVEETRHDSVKSDGQETDTVNSSDNLAYCLDTGSEESERCPDKRVEKCSQRSEVSPSQPAQTQECDASTSNHENQNHGAMERALEHQAELIGCYEAQEKAQMDWEEKYAENNTSTPDSCEPGNHSDVTEERDENKAVAPCASEIIAGHKHDQKAGAETTFHGKEPSITQFNSFKLTPRADTGSSRTHDFSKRQASQTPDFAFSKVNNNQTRDHVPSPSYYSSAQNSPSYQRPAGPIPSSCCGSTHSESELPENRNNHHAVLPQEEPHRLGAVLGALEEAKLLIKLQMNRPLERTSGSIGEASETSVSAIRDVDLFKIPVGSAGLFRVPIDLHSQASQSKLLGSGHPYESIDPHLYSGTAVLQGDQYLSSPVNRRPSISNTGPYSGSPSYGSEPGIATRQPRFDFHFDTNQSSSSKSNFPSHPSFPDFFPRVSSNQTSFSQVPVSEVGVYPSRSPMYYDRDVRPHMYR